MNHIMEIVFNAETTIPKGRYREMSKILYEITSVVKFEQSDVQEFGK
jgi:hypothetical protein